MMNYLKLQVADSLKLPWLRASMQTRGVLVTLLMYCCAQENDGVIDGCKSWSNDEWRDLLRLTLADIEALVGSGLAWWNQKGGLVFDLYDTEGQRALEIKRAQGRHGKKGGRPPPKKPIRETHKGTHMYNPHTTPHQCGESSPNGSPPGPFGFRANGPEAEAKQANVSLDLRGMMASKEKRTGDTP